METQGGRRPKARKGDLLVRDTENGLGIRCGWTQVLDVIRLFPHTPFWCCFCAGLLLSYRQASSRWQEGWLWVIPGGRRTNTFLLASVCGPQGRSLMGPVRILAHP